MKSPPFSEEADYPDEFVPHAIDPYETDTLQKDSTEGESESVDQELPLRPRKIRNTFWPIRAFYSLVQLSVTITSTCPWLIFRLLDGMLSKIFDSIEDYDNSTDNRK
ncbi:hypothetical protein CLU79DRAFT_717144 [Phycomyces nitens]|nr:hypothetical protein CLU79DRAFT_717144 [Phycomyces nitens]